MLLSNQIKNYSKVPYYRNLPKDEQGKLRIISFDFENVSETTSKLVLAKLPLGSIKIVDIFFESTNINENIEGSLAFSDSLKGTNLEPFSQINLTEALTQKLTLNLDYNSDKSMFLVLDLQNNLNFSSNSSLKGFITYVLD